MSFSIVVDPAVQLDGGQHVVETHFDGQGEFAYLFYSAPAGADYNALATIREETLLLSAAEKEFDRAIETDSMVPLRFQTGAEALVRLRLRYRHYLREDLCRLARWIVNRVVAGDITVTQLRNAFNLNQSEWDALRTRMENLAADVTGVEVAAGE